MVVVIGSRVTGLLHLCMCFKVIVEGFHLNLYIRVTCLSILSHHLPLSDKPGGRGDV